MTYYITKNGLELLFANISEILQQNNIKKIEILADKKEWAKLFYFQEKGLLKNLKETFRVNKKLNINIKPVDCGSNLFHAKSYALIHDSEKEGFVITTSANLTDNGLRENLEFCNFTSDIASIKSYICSLQDIKEKFTLSPESEKELEDLAEAYTILSTGTFYAEKTEIQTLCPLFLSKKGQDEISETFKLIGGDKIFEEKVKKTISYRLVDYITTKNLLPPLIPPTVISNYSIKTSIGRWIPNSVSQFINERIDSYKEV
jgi:HKD family nuclease